jgi:HEAT repeat protein
LAILDEGKEAVAVIKDALQSTEAADRVAALWMAGALAEAAKDLLPAIRTRLKDDSRDARLMAVWALGEIDQAGIDAGALAVLEELLKDKVQLRNAPLVFSLLGRLGAKAKSAVPALRALVVEKESDLTLRLKAARVLGSIGPPAREALPALFVLVHDIVLARDLDSAEISDSVLLGKPRAIRIHRLASLGDVDLQRDAEQALQRVRKSAFREIGQLEGVLTEEAALLQQEILSLIARIGPAAVQPACDDLKSERLGTRIRAARVLSRLGPRARAGIPALRAALKDHHLSVAVEAAVALYAITNEGDNLIEVLGRGLDAPGTTALRAAGVLAQIGPAASKAVPSLIKALRSRRGAARREAARALGAIGAEAKPACDGLQERLRDPRTGVRVQAALALQRIESKIDPVPILLAALREADSPAVRRAVIDAFSALGDKAKPLLAYLFPLLEDSHHQVRTAAARLVWKLSKDGRAVLEVLQRSAGNAQVRSSVRVAALKTLGEMGKQARPATAVVAGIMRDPLAPNEVRLQAREALKALGR